VLRLVSSTRTTLLDLTGNGSPVDKGVCVSTENERAPLGGLTGLQVFGEAA